ncbi:uncharacterized protein LOC135942105 [Cloeon dipterum]|uniref:uncharacterized protein LOC135942105 n=1 Tax=Cloeon dipterum TaxID=197152 RepID=UPI003220678B
MSLGETPFVLQEDKEVEMVKPIELHDVTENDERGDTHIRPQGKANLGFFESEIDGRVTRQNADNVCVLVIHYDFKDNPEYIRNGDACDVENLKTSFGKNRNCNFRNFRSPNKNILLKLLGDQEMLLQFFNSQDDVPSVFVLFILSHGTENGTILTDHFKRNTNDYERFARDEVFDSLQKLTKFEESLKIVNFGPCRGPLEDSKFDIKNPCQNYANMNECRITTRPGMHNFVTLYSTVETARPKRDEPSFFVKAFCECLNRNEEQPLLKLLTSVQCRIHKTSLAGTNCSTGQTPELKMFQQDRSFVFSKSLDPIDSKTGKVALKSQVSEFYSWKSDSGNDIRGRRAFIFCDKQDEHAQELERALRWNLDFETRKSPLSQESLNSCFEKVSKLEPDVGCILTCVFGQVTENQTTREACVLVDGKETKITSILHNFVGPKSDSLIGKPKILFIVHQEAHHSDWHHRQQFEASGNFETSATNHSGWLVLILKNKGAVERLIEILKHNAPKKGRSLQELLEPLLISSEEKSERSLLNSTLQYHLNFPDFPRHFVKLNFALKSKENVALTRMSFDDLLEQMKSSQEAQKIWLLSSVAGAGKTTVLKEIAFQLGKSDPHIKTLCVQLKKSLFCTALETYNSAVKFLAEATRNSSEDINDWIRKKRAFVLLDGFDEVCPQYRSKVLTLLEALEVKKIPLCVSTRPHEAKAIMETVENAVMIEIEPLNEEQQIDFLKNLGKNEEEIAPFIGNFPIKDILVNPLHLFLLAKSKTKGNLYKMYDNVVRQKVKECLAEKVFERQEEEALSSLRLIASRFIMESSLVRPELQDLQKVNSDYGVATVWNGEVRFLHQTFAEFLSAQKFIEDFEKEPAFFKQSFSEVRKFIDLFYSYLEKDGEKRELRLQTAALLTLARSLGPLFFLKKVVQENLQHIFKIVKQHISFRDEFNASIWMKPSPDLFISAIGSEEIAIELLDMGVLDLKGLEQNLSDILLQIEEHNAVGTFEKLKLIFPGFRDIVDACYYHNVEMREPLRKVGIKAARRNNAKLLELLLQIGIGAFNHFEVEDSFYNACKHGSVECVKVLLKYRRRIDAYYDPLTVAARNGHLDLVKYLLEENICGFKRDPETLKVEGLVQEWNAFHFAVNEGHKSTAEYLLSKSPSLVRCKTQDGTAPIQMAVRQTNVEMLLWLAEHDLESLKPSKERKDWSDIDLSYFEHFLMLQGDVTAKEERGKTALHCAAKYGYLELVRKLIASGADVQVKDQEGWNALHYACCKDIRFEIIETLHLTSTLLSKETTNEGKTALHILVENCENDDNALEAVRFLVEESGVDVDAGDKRGRTALTIVLERELNRDFFQYLISRSVNTSLKDKFGRSALHYAAMTDDSAALQKWIKLCGDLNIRDDLGRTALHLAAEKGNWCFVRNLIQSGSNLGATDKFGRSPLMLACENTYTDIVEMLLSQNSSLNIQDLEGNTALHYATKSGELNLIKKLLEKGSDVNVRENNGWTVLHIAVRDNQNDLLQKLLEYKADVNSKEKSGLTALHLACQSYPGLVQKLLDHGADVNLKNPSGWAALHVAIQENCPELVEQLINHGADVNMKGNNGWVALHIATIKNNVNLLRILLESGADANQKTEKGMTPLHLAVIQQNKESVQILLDHGADVNIKNQDGWTALHFATKNNCPELVQKLLEHGADVRVKNEDGLTALDLVAGRNYLFSAQKLLDYGVNEQKLITAHRVQRRPVPAESEFSTCILL